MSIITVRQFTDAPPSPPSLFTSNPLSVLFRHTDSINSRAAKQFPNDSASFPTDDSRPMQNATWSCVAARHPAIVNGKINDRSKGEAPNICLTCESEKRKRQYHPQSIMRRVPEFGDKEEPSPLSTSGHGKMSRRKGPRTLVYSKSVSIRVAALGRTVKTGPYRQRSVVRSRVSFPCPCA